MTAPPIPPHVLDALADALADVLVAVWHRQQGSAGGQAVAEVADSVPRDVENLAEFRLVHEPSVGSRRGLDHSRDGARHREDGGGPADAGPASFLDN